MASLLSNPLHRLEGLAYSGGGCARSDFEPLLNECVPGLPLDEADLHQVRPDMMIVMPSPFAEGGDGDSFINPRRILDEVFVQKSEAKELFTRMEALRTKDMVRLRDMREAIFIDLCSYLPYRGVAVWPFLSADHRDVFLRISMCKDSVDQLAQRKRRRVQTTTEVIELLGIEQDVKHTSPVYLDFVLTEYEELRRQLKDRHGREFELFKRYYEQDLHNGSIFRTVDRIHMIYDILLQRLDIDRLIWHGIMSAHYPNHSAIAVERFQRTWSRMGLLSDFTFPQPLTSINDYFGSTVAFSCVWLGYSARTLLPLALASLVFCAAENAFPDYYLPLRIADISVLTVWTIFYMKYWKRAEAVWKQEWDLDRTDVSAMTTLRPEYRGELLPALWDAKVLVRQYPPWKNTLAHTFTKCVTGVSMCLVLWGIALLYQGQEDAWAEAVFGENWKFWRSMFISLQIKVCKKIWGYVITPLLVYIENPRTTAEYYDAIVYKLVPFNFVNAYYSFFYVAFIKNHNSDSCETGRQCAAELQNDLYVTYSMLACMSLIELSWPYLLLLWAQWRDHLRMRAYMKQHGLQTPPPRSLMEMQAQLPIYEVPDQVRDVLEIVLQIGYTVLFGSVAPLIALPCFLLVAVEIRLNAWKLVRLYQRTHPVPTTGLGAWNRILGFLFSCGRVTAIAVPLVNLEQFASIRLIHKAVLLLGLKQAGDWLRDALDQYISDSPAIVKHIDQQRRYVARCWSHFSIESEDLTGHVNTCWGVRHKADLLQGHGEHREVLQKELQPLDARSPIWEHVDTGESSPRVVWE